MYVVGYIKKALKIGPGDVRLSGEEVPEADTWKPNVLSSHLSLKWIQTQEEWDAAKKAEDARLDARKKAKKIYNDGLKKRADALRAAQAAKRKQQGEKEDEPEVEETEPVETNTDTETTEDTEPELTDGDQLDTLTKKELQNKCRELGKPVGGTKAELVDRIRGAGQ